MKKETKTRDTSLRSMLLLPLTAAVTIAFAMPDMRGYIADETQTPPTEMAGDSTKSKKAKKKAAKGDSATVVTPSQPTEEGVATTEKKAVTPTDKSEPTGEKPAVKEAERLTESTPVDETKGAPKGETAKLSTDKAVKNAPLTDDNIAAKTDATIELKNGSISLVDEQGADATAAANPVFVVDGVKTDRAGVGQLSTGDIESMEVAKDAATIKQYAGEEEAGSVVFINTKAGKGDKK